MKKYMLVLLFVILSILCIDAFANPYVEVGLGYNLNNNNTYCVKERTNTTCLDDPLGYVALGYEYKNFTVAYEHWSNLTEKDYGLNLITVKYRYTFGE